MSKSKKLWLAILGPMIGSFVGMLSETSLNIALPNLSKNLGVGTDLLQWIITGYMLIIGIILPLSSLLTKRFTTRQIITAGIFAFIIGSIISALSNNFLFLLIGRMIQGLGTGTILPLMFTIAMNIFPQEKLGTAMGMCSLVIMFAPAVGPTLTGLILAKLSWNWIFWLFIPFLLLALFFDLKFLPNINKLTKEKIDFISVFLSALGFGSIVTSFSCISKFSCKSPIVLITLFIGIFALVIYIYRQLYNPHPILNLHIFKNVDFVKGSLLVMINFSIILSAMFLLPQYIQKGILIPVALTGIIMLPGGLVNALVSGLAGRLFDNYGAKILTLLGFTIALIGSIMLLDVSNKSEIFYVIIAHIILMIGCPLAMSPSQTYALNSLKLTESADGSTIINTLQQIIGAVATAITTSFLNLGINNYHGNNSSAAFTNGTHFGMLFTIILTIIGLIISLTIPKFKNK